jgi:hypothetical protein
LDSFGKATYIVVDLSNSRPKDAPTKGPGKCQIIRFEKSMSHQMKKEMLISSIERIILQKKNICGTLNIELPVSLRSVIFDFHRFSSSPANKICTKEKVQKFILQSVCSDVLQEPLTFDSDIYIIFSVFLHNDNSVVHNKKLLQKSEVNQMTILEVILLVTKVISREDLVDTNNIGN